MKINLIYKYAYEYIAILLLIFFIIFGKINNFETLTNTNTASNSNSCKINNRNLCNSKPNCQWNNNNSNMGCSDISCNSINVFYHCDKYDKCNWDQRFDVCSASDTMVKATRKKVCNRYNGNGREIGCRSEGCEYKDSKCLISSCQDINDKEVCSNNYNCVWSNALKLCSKDLHPSECVNHWEWSEEECKKNGNSKCFWNPNKNGPMYKTDGRTGRCDAIKPSDWKP